MATRRSLSSNGFTRYAFGCVAFAREYQEVGVHLPLWQNVNRVISRILPNFKNSGLQIIAELENTEIYADPR
ncbi:MAG: hypothetical protein WCH85_10640 [Methanomicrobiales archaeon]